MSRKEVSKMAEYVQERIGDYIQVNSGRYFYVLDPRPEDITVEDIAHSLSNLCRFTGHGDRFYSVGEHSIYCAKIARKLGLPTLQQLYCLLHDASESVMNDLARPVKQNIPQYKEIEDNVMAVMWKVVGLPKPTEEDYRIVKIIDNTMLINEMEQLMHRSDIPDIEHIPVFINLSVGYGAGESKKPFLDIYNALMDEYLEDKLKLINEGYFLAFPEHKDIPYWSGCNYHINHGNHEVEPVGTATSMHDCCGCEMIETCEVKKETPVWRLK
jgi:uncharacterized protein